MIYYNYKSEKVPQSGVSSRTISGTQAAETLAGSDGNDAFTGIVGADTLIGGAGDDLYVIQDAGIRIVEAANSGIDTVKVTMDYVLPDHVENLMIFGQGLRNGFTGIGNGLDNLMVGNLYNETFNGLGGNDVLVGGGGSDTFVFAPSGGHDAIVDFTTGAGVGSDVLRLQDFGLTNFAQVKAAMSQVGADVVLSLGAGDDIILRNTTVGAFTRENFELSVDFSNLKLSFQDEFNVLSTQTLGKAGTGIWATEYGFAGWGSKTSHYIGFSTGEDQIYVDPTYKGTGKTALGINPFSINDGVLTITATPTTPEQKAALYGIDFASGLLTTRTSFTQTYGYFEMRAKMPSGAGAWPAFWLFSSDGTQEMDIFEVASERASTIALTVHDKSLASSAVRSSAYVPDASSAFHTYGLLWTPTTLTYYIDGVAVFDTPTPASMHVPMYILLNQAVGGWATAPDPANMPTGLQVDYVRAYSLEAPQTGVSTPTEAAPPVAEVAQPPQSATPVATAPADTSQSQEKPNAFDGDLRSALVWREAGGMFTIWDMKLPQIEKNAYVGHASADWHIAAMSDFNGDGSSDLLWRNDNGAFTIWQASDESFQPNVVFDETVSTDWSLAATADMNGDGKADLIWRNASGTFTEWRSNGEGFDKNVYVNSGVDVAWKLFGAFDFNGDGKSDLLWRHESGALTQWLGTDAGFAPNAYTNFSMGSDQQLLASADFNGDGKSDLLWRDDVGRLTTWQSTGGDFQVTDLKSVVPSDWQLQNSGDFNGDGLADLLWRHSSGVFTVWQNTDHGFVQNVVVDASVGTNWSLA